MRPTHDTARTRTSLIKLQPRSPCNHRAKPDRGEGQTKFHPRISIAGTCHVASAMATSCACIDRGRFRGSRTLQHRLCAPEGSAPPLVARKRHRDLGQRVARRGGVENDEIGGMSNCNAVVSDVH